ncbi:MAG: pilin [Thiocapsa sp.]|uniref:pilin n=1 Tax=Thiocapsa sp. TaxID=2024551 RepID=UPI001BCC1908|nr:pilin [Thiocapsa sp.]QVL47495.1 MAG: pilin [Thiocapsa sp.]
MHHDIFHSQQGFNLIELMVTVAAIGILATIAVPAYQDYTIRAKVSEALGMGSAAKVAVATSAAVGQIDNIDQSTSGYDALSDPGQYVAAIEIEDGGIIVMTTRNTGAAIDPVLKLKPTMTGGGLDHPFAHSGHRMRRQAILA